VSLTSPTVLTKIREARETSTRRCHQTSYKAAVRRFESFGMVEYPKEGSGA
jgi:hypothetical protein